MNRLFNRVFGCSEREKTTQEALARREEEHTHAIAEMDTKLNAAKQAAAESRSAARSLLKRLSEDIPK